jgi:hypothetical protein
MSEARCGTHTVIPHVATLIGLCWLQRMAARAWTLPEDYRFDRDEANAR